MSAEVLTENLTEAEFGKYWLVHGPRLIEDSWRAKYGGYIVNVAVCSDEAVSHPLVLPQNNEAGQHEAAWNRLWREHSWEIYLKQMNQMLRAELPQDTPSDLRRQQSITSQESTADIRQLSADSGQRHTNDRKQKELALKRPLSLTDFGLVSRPDSCSIKNLHVKKQRFNKIRQESPKHRRLPLSTSTNTLDDAPKDARLAKYWAQRYRLFRGFDEGIQLNEAAWFSVTAEKIAEHVAARVCPRSVRKSNFVVAVFCGVGGDVVQLALRSPLVLSVDNDTETIEMAEHNAGIYGVEKKS